MALFDSEVMERARLAVRHGIDRIPTGGSLSRADQRVWDEVESIADAGELVARWLEGDMETAPGYYGRPAAETEEMIPDLAELNRSGFVTLGSQPGEGPVRGNDNTWWWQRAFVDGISDVAVADRIEAASRGEGLEPVRHHGASRRTDYSRNMPVTATHDHVAHGRGFVATGTGVGLSRRDLQLCFGGYLHDEVRRAEQTSVIDPVWGRNSLLLPTLTRELARDERVMDDRTDPLVREAPAREGIELGRYGRESLQRTVEELESKDPERPVLGEPETETPHAQQRKARRQEERESPAGGERALEIPPQVGSPAAARSVTETPERTVDGSELTAKWVDHMRTGEQAFGSWRGDDQARCADGHLLEAHDPNGWTSRINALTGEPRVHRDRFDLEQRYGRDFIRDIRRRNDRGESLARLADHVELNARDREVPRTELERGR